MTTRPQVGSKVFRICYGPGKQPFLACTNFLGQKGGWCTYRHLTSGHEWKERGYLWYSDKDSALEAELCLLATTLHVINTQEGGGHGDSEDDYMSVMTAIIRLCNLPMIRDSIEP